MSRYLSAAAFVLGACGFSGKAPATDAGSGSNNDGSPLPDDGNVIDGALPTGTLTPGGGVTGGAIAGLIDIYVIDAITGGPLANAQVAVGTQGGMTNANGLFIAHDPSLVGKQTILATLAFYRSELWVGVAGSSVTMALLPSPLGPVPQGTISATINNFGTPAPPAGHYRAGFGTYSNSATAYPGANDLQGPATNCFASATCTLTIASRTGHVAVAAGIYDIDSHNTMDPRDDTAVLTTYAIGTGLEVAAGQTVPVALDELAGSAIADTTVTAGTGTPNLPNVASYLGLDLGDDGTLYLPAQVAANKVKAPKLATYAGATYTAVGIASDGKSPETRSTVVRRGNTTMTMDLGAWLGLPTTIAPTTTAISWTPPAGATLDAARFDGVLEIMVFDDTTTVAIPAGIAIAHGSAGQVQALRGTIDPTNFGFVTDLAKFDGYAVVPFAVP